MDWVSLLITYAICWWLVLFMVLPFGIDFSEKSADSAYAGAPRRANMKKKILITSFLAIPMALLVQWGFQTAIAEVMP